LPIRVGVGGTPQSFARAGLLGLPLAVAIIGGEPRRFRPLIDFYRESGRQAGHASVPTESASSGLAGSRHGEAEAVARQRSSGLDVSIHSIGFIADTTEQAASDFYPSYSELFNRIGKERGWPPIGRAQFDASRGPTGALVIGDPETIAEKIIYENNVLGGINRFTILFNGGMIGHRKTMHAIELLGTRVAPMVRKELAGNNAGIAESAGNAGNAGNGNRG
jgi:alkanesulfonate monooxygenase SsuD/methylene tetrahydromethanopterin reductase-like flavin-dependent oxidoreductase (luciferase family)